MISVLRDFLRSRLQDYRYVFKSQQGIRVLDDLAKFCRAHESTFDNDPRVEGILQGRREVWLRIARHLNMTEDELWSHFNPKGDT